MSSVFSSQIESSSIILHILKHSGKIHYEGEIFINLPTFTQNEDPLDSATKRLNATKLRGLITEQSFIVLHADNRDYSYLIKKKREKKYKSKYYIMHNRIYLPLRISRNWLNRISRNQRLLLQLILTNIDCSRFIVEISHGELLKSGARERIHLRD